MGRKPKLPEGLWERNGVYYARFRANGREVRKRLSGDLRAAKELLNELKARADKADFNLIDNDYAWDSLKDEFIRWKRQTSRMADEYESDLDKFTEHSAVRSIRQVTHEYVGGFRDWRLNDGISPRTINKQVGVLHHMLNMGVEWKRIGSNPIEGIKPLPEDEPTKRRRSLSVDEVLAIFEASPAYLKPVWRMFMVTGVRKDELVNMKFADVDIERRTVTVRRVTSKNHRERDIPLDDTALAIILELREKAKDRQPVKGWTDKLTAQQLANFSKEHVFVTTANTPFRNNLLTRFYSVCKRAGIADGCTGGSVDIHSLRVTFTTLSIDHGASPKAIQAILGHSTLGLTMGVYAKATERAKRDAVSALPFANASAPAHVVSVQDAHTTRTSRKTKSQRKKA
jgi:integrase